MTARNKFLGVAAIVLSIAIIHPVSPSTAIAEAIILFVVLGTVARHISRR